MIISCAIKFISHQFICKFFISFNTTQTQLFLIPLSFSSFLIYFIIFLHTFHSQNLS